ncbi:hypothetical protein J8L73_11970 [Pseudoalteromonas sp. MMG006]|uniref:hypothetical protein n=1 Tax=unclassified Pseudoalteromonas TaxID=194690 RepID=UPI001B38E33E|nr:MULTISPECIES: hypothetical protein [unclassified Pseudoalteromonas]MBQ4799837.1 hypothetical protein [Pseudoalteromonas sp. MMG006]MBQ4857566.1 hypothetical protein [Pseudoalteromonas sp. MMG007]
MTYVVFFALLLLITLLASYLKIESNRKKAIEAKKKLFNERVSQVNARLKTKLNELLDAKVIRPKYIPRIQAILSNFFVVQPHTDENLQQLEDIADLLISTLTNELIKINQTNFIQSLIDNVQHFVSELPQQGILYNKQFYTNKLPTLISNIKTEDFSQPTDIENETANTIPLTPDPRFVQEASVA